MRFLVLVLFLFSFQSHAGSFYDLEFPNLEQEAVAFSKFKGKVLLITNIASQCGYTPQLEGLQKIYEKYKGRGFTVLGFPSNDFNQENKEGKEIADFCKLNYGVNFPLFKKSHINGEKRNPVYQYLISNSNSPNDDISWNFEKFLVSKSGKVIARYKSDTKPTDKKIINDVESALQE